MSIGKTKFMKNNSSSRFGMFLRKVFNSRLWSDWSRMKTFTTYIVNGVKQFFVLQKAKKTESFENAKKRLNLTDKDLLARQNGLLRVSLVMVAFAILMLIYSLYLLFALHVMSSLLSLVVMSLALILAFRYHFWYFQIKSRKLGCSIHEWYRQGLLGDKQ